MKRLLIASITSLLSLTVPASAATPPQNVGISAVVGGEAITSYDLENRIRFIITTTKLSNTPDVIARIRPQVLQSLINEKLQLQDAQARGVSVSEQEIKDAIVTIEKERNMSPGAIFSMLDKSNVPHGTFTDQLTAQLTWNKLMLKYVRPLVKISDEEIELAGKRFVAPVAIKELQIGIFTLPVDKPSRDPEMKRFAEKMVSEIRAGASFEEVTRQFTGGRGGNPDTFWVRPNQLDPAIGTAIYGAKPGFISAPVRTEAGYNIVKVYAVRAQEKEKTAETEVLLKEILLRLKRDASVKEAGVLLQIGEDVAKNPGSCEEKGMAGIKELDDFDIEVDFRRNVLSELPNALRIIAENLKVGDISTPFASSEGIRLYMLCDKKAIAEKPVDIERVRSVIYQQKMELEAQKYMRNLRRDGFVEIRN